MSVEEVLYNANPHTGSCDAGASRGFGGHIDCSQWAERPVSKARGDWRRKPKVKLSTISTDAEVDLHLAASEHCPLGPISAGQAWSMTQPILRPMGKRPVPFR